MHCMEYRITTLNPVLLSSGTADQNMTGSLDYITGKSLLGALASQYIQKNKPEKAHENKEFARWFLLGGLSFSNAYPVWEDEKFYPAPLALREGKGDGVVYNFVEEENLEPVPTKGLRGFVRLEGGKVKKISPEKTITFHNSRNDRIKGKSTEGAIFNYEALREGQLFQGMITGKVKDLKAVKKMFGDMLNLEIGRSRSVQYGRIELKWGNIYDSGGIEKDFSREVLVTLTSPAILVNQWGYPEVSQEILEQYLKDALGTDNFALKSFFARADDTESYISVWKLKSPGEKALTAGTCFILEFPEITKNLEGNLLELSQRGIGERTWEGFGQLVFDLLNRDRYLLEDEKSINQMNVDKPQGTMPQVVKNCFCQVVKKTLERQAADKGLRDAQVYYQVSAGKPLNNSVLGKLELMLKNAENPEEFRTMIREIKKIGMDKLKAYRNKNETLLDALQNERWHFQLEVTGELEKLIKEIGFEIRNPDFQQQLYRIYWLSFFTATRKLNKGRKS
jgi:CRISPR-associated protein Csx10